MAAAAVDREFGCIYSSFGLILKCAGMLPGPHCCVLFVPLWGTSGVSLGHLGQSWGALWDIWHCPPSSWERLGIALGLFWASFEKKCPLGHPSQADGSQVPRLRTKIDPLEFARRSRRSRGNGPRTAVQDLPCTRAGDQDDMSFTNSLKT